MRLLLGPLSLEPSPLLPVFWSLLPPLSLWRGECFCALCLNPKFERHTQVYVPNSNFEFSAYLVETVERGCQKTTLAGVFTHFSSSPSFLPCPRGFNCDALFPVAKTSSADPDLPLPLPISLLAHIRVRRGKARNNATVFDAAATAAARTYASSSFAGKEGGPKSLRRAAGPRAADGRTPRRVGNEVTNLWNKRLNLRGS